MPTCRSLEGLLLTLRGRNVKVRSPRCAHMGLGLSVLGVIIARCHRSLPTSFTLLSQGPSHNKYCAMVRATRDLTEIARQVLRGEREYVASHAGRSQYSAGGMSACGLAALNCARIVLQREKATKVGPEEFVSSMMQRELCEVCEPQTRACNISSVHGALYYASQDVLGICLQWTSSAHLDVDEISSAAIFEKTLNQSWSEYERPGFEQFQALLK